MCKTLFTHMPLLTNNILSPHIVHVHVCMGRVSQIGCVSMFACLFVHKNVASKQLFLHDGTVKSFNFPGKQGSNDTCTCSSTPCKTFSINSLKAYFLAFLPCEKLDKHFFDWCCRACKIKHQNLLDFQVEAFNRSYTL